MKTNYHAHSTWCDGSDTVAAMAQAAADRGFDEFGFSSHARFPDERGTFEVPPARFADYRADVLAAAARHAPGMRVLCGVEADFIPGVASPDRSVYAAAGPDYVIGSVHWVPAADGAIVPVDASPSSFAAGLRDHFGGDGAAFAREYFRLQREMLATCRFDLLGHPDLIRKFNAKHPWFDEAAPWYLGELEATADAIARAGVPVEVNTGAISRGWLDDAYPSKPFRDLLRARGVSFVLSSDAHSTAGVDCAFDRFGSCEAFVRPGW
jgi:histidinol-phosphatase (PHP family)